MAAQAMRSLSKGEPGRDYAEFESKISGGIRVFSTPHRASRHVAEEIVTLINDRDSQGKTTVLGLATGATPIALYGELIRMYKEGKVSFKNVITFNLDEYAGLDKGNPNSYHFFMWHHLFSHIDISPENVHIPSGLPCSDQAVGSGDGCENGGGYTSFVRECERYESLIESHGGIDYQILGIGRTGHVGFNEPGSHRHSKTRLIFLDPITRRDAAKGFGGEENTPIAAVTMGVGTISRARRIVLMAFGMTKSDIVATATEGPITDRCPSTYLQEHANTTFVLDQGAARKLEAYTAPWTKSWVVWDTKLTLRATIWLARKLGKAVRRLVRQDYAANGLDGVLEFYGNSVGSANEACAKHLERTIERSVVPTCPEDDGDDGSNNGTIKEVDESDDPIEKGEEKKTTPRVVIMSPHPDDDVISCGGGLLDLVRSGCEVHVAYMTPGSNAVPWKSVWEKLSYSIHAGLVKGTNAEEAKRWCADFVANGGRYQPLTTQEIPDWLENCRRSVREIEAMSAALVAGVPQEHLHFLRLPMYGNKSHKHADEDLRIVTDLFEEIRPHRIFIAGDLADPHGTHKMCFDVIRISVSGLVDRAREACESPAPPISSNSSDFSSASSEIDTHKGSGAVVCSSPRPAPVWVRAMDIAIYRGAWDRWELHEIDIVVALDSSRVRQRRHAILCHTTQRGEAMFMGNDTREFYERAESGGRELAKVYGELGMLEFESLEAFVTIDADKWVKHGGGRMAL